ncbi:hypothetical protein [Saccharopolyspora cebuensis]|uniref:SPW repeat-containing protein n=1 Tax=Saccharopolyspora cebuensis TaxID=418759 RepID=A0ABV4CI17_9PSEU
MGRARGVLSRLVGAAVVVGLVGAVLLGEWQYALTGALVMALLAAVLGTPEPPDVLSAAGFTCLVAGSLGWVWLGDMRWAVLGALVLVATSAVGAVLERRGVSG